MTPSRPRQPHTGGHLGTWGRGPDSGGTTFGEQLNVEFLGLMENGDVTPPTDVSPDVRAQLKYLNSRKGGHEATECAGIPARTRRGWKTRTPSPASRQRINHAYWQLRATNWKRTGRTPPPGVREAVAPQLKERAHGKRMSITPVDWRDVRKQAQGAQKEANEREIRPSQRSWDNLIDAWSTGDETTLDTVWMDYASEIDSPPELYYEVAHIGFAL
ncbi:hypothetical protein SSP35_34_00180 [Streptomyces sp. NBRC 110611]|uniref:hypothetical protein n=1 Tax=Streptomyces sp. NBRC 110611 TaxID=1621259 RepID=UPI000857D713|nr:hypothetical protein [Streptomyces sp. NBRC 110611]GAU71333.1 hypothetical protein SSP35_34_00180 [Streptomyces sp. NBRC 110611]